MKPEYIGLGNFDEDNYVYVYCKCPLPADWAIKWPRIKDGKPHSYICTCEDCGTTVSVISKSYGPEVLKQQPCEVTEYDKDHIWYKGSQYISLRRFLEVKKEIEDKVSRIIDDHPLDGYEDGQLILKTIRDIPPDDGFGFVDPFSFNKGNTK